MIEVIDVVKQYGNVRAIDHVSLRIESGEVFGLLGPNGAGKTTMIRMLTTLGRPDSGRCLIDNFDVVRDAAEIKRRIGVVPQENNLDRELTAYENLRIYSLLHQVTDAREKIVEHLKAVGLLDRKDSVVSHFSGGMQRRLLLARALLPEPSVLFLDEPSVGLDPQVRRQMGDIIRKTKREGRTVFITTHYIEEAEALCDRVAVLSKGKLIALGSPSSLKATVGEYVVEVIDEEGRLVPHICRNREEAHELARGREDGVTIRRSNLEDVFIKLTGERIE